MATLTFPLNINQGEAWSVTFPVIDANNNPMNVTGWTAKAQIRGAPGETVLYEWSAANSNITVSGTTVTISLTGAVSAAWTWIGINAEYDLYVTNLSGQPYRIAQGPVIVSPEVTQLP